MAIAPGSYSFIGGAVLGNNGGKQFVLTRDDMTTAFTDEEYNQCINALMNGLAVAVSFGTIGILRQAQLVSKTNLGALTFSCTRKENVESWTVAALSPHTITQDAYDVDNDITPLVNTGTKIAEGTVNGQQFELFAPNGGCDQVVLVRSDMTTDFTNTEYQECVDAVTAEKAVCVQFVMTGTTIQAQLTQVMSDGTLVFEFTAENHHYRWEVDATNNAHVVEPTGKIFGVPVFDTLQDAITSEYTLKSGDIFETNGFHTSGDGGAARYRVSSTGTANGMDIIQLSAGKLAILQVQDFAYPDQLGYERNDGTQDVVPYINQIFSLGILHIKLHWGRYYMRQTLSLPIASSIEGVARAAYDYPAMSRMILMTTTGDCAINASNYDVRLENFDLYCSGDLSGKIGVLTNSWDNSQRGIVFRNFKVSQFQTSIKLSNLVNWNILFDRVTFEYGDYGLWIEANKLVINLSDCYFNGIREEDVHTKQYSTALSFSHCNFGCRKKVFKNEWNNLDWRNFGEVSFYGCNFEVDVYDLANVSGCFVDIDDGCQVSLSFVGCDFNVDQANPASVTCFKFGNRTRATYIGCHGKESQYVHFDGDFFDTSYPPEATPGSLVIDSTCVGLKTPTYDSAHSMSCRDERELFESYTHINPLNIFDNVVVNYSYAGVRDTGGGVLEFFTADPPQSCASIVIDVPAGYRNIPLTLSAWTGTHNRWIAVATPAHPDADRSQTPTLLADTYSTADGRDYCSINMNGNRYLLLYYYLMSADGNPEKFAMSEGLMLSEGSYHYPYVNHIVVDKNGYHISEKFIPPVKIAGRSGALPLSSCDDLVPTDTGLKIFGEVNTFGGTSGGLPAGFSGIGILESTAMVNFTRCLQVLFGGNGKIYTRRAIRNTTSDPWTWQSWYTFTGV